MLSVEVDLSDDRFDGAFEPALVSIDDILGAISDLDYQPEILAEPGAKPVLVDRIDLAVLPDDLENLFAKAKARDKPVLLEFSGPG